MRIRRRATLHALLALGSAGCASEQAERGARAHLSARSSAAVGPSHEPSSAPPSVASAGPVTVSTPCVPLPGRPAKRPLFDPDLADDFVPRATPAQVGLDGALLDQLVDGAVRAQSDTLLLMKDDRLVIERELGTVRGPIETRSVTKGIAALGILALIADGAIPGLDVPLAHFFEEFSLGDKRAVTLRQVMNHTSGLRHSATDADALNAQGNRSAYARGLPVVVAPGTVFSYSNEATQLLSPIIERASGEAADVYLGHRVFEALGIRDVPWKRDRAGNVQTYYGLSLRARDLARIGALIVHGGLVGKRRVLPEALVGELFVPGVVYGGYGLCFWLDPRVAQRSDKRATLPPGFDQAAFAELDGRSFSSSEAYFVELKKRVPEAQYVRLRTLHRERRGPLETLSGPASALISLGGLGQRLEVHPASKLVAVRQHRRQPGDDAREKLVTFREMQEHLFRIEASAGCPI